MMQDRGGVLENLKIATLNTNFECADRRKSLELYIGIEYTRSTYTMRTPTVQ